MYIAQGFGDGVNERMTFFDAEGRIAPFQRKDYAIYKEAKLPETFSKMKEESERLAGNFPFVRVDWFEAEGKMYFGEMTFTPSGCMLKVEPREYDRIWGEMLQIK